MSLLRTCVQGTRAVIGFQGSSQYTVDAEWLQPVEVVRK